MSDQISNAGAKAELIGTMIEAICYGMYFVVFLRCIVVLRKKHLENKPSTVLSLAAVCIFVLVTIHLVMDFMRVVQAYTSNMDVPLAAIFYYTIVRRDLDLIKSGCYIAVTLVSDALICYRTFVVWGNNYIFALIPSALFFADIALGIYAVFLLSQVTPGDNALMSMVTERVKYFYAVTLALNLLCTIMISYKIWRVQSEVDQNTNTSGILRPKSSRVIGIIVESAAIYSAMLIVLIASSATNAVAMLALLDAIAPIIGIVFSMVIIRFSTDSTRWESLKMTTHLDFTSASNARALSDKDSHLDIELESALGDDTGFFDAPLTPPSSAKMVNVGKVDDVEFGIDGSPGFSVSRVNEYV